MVPDLQTLTSINPGIPDVALPSAAVEISKSVANVALDKISSVQDRASASAIPSAAVDISKSLATVVAASTNAATETGTRAISSLFGRFGGVINMASTTSPSDEKSSFNDDGNDILDTTETSDNETSTDLETKNSPHIKPTVIQTDAFYESIVRHKDNFNPDPAQKSLFDDFSSNVSLRIDAETLNLVCNHYRYSMESDEKDELEWKTLHSILLKITNEDAILGSSLLISEILENYKKFVTVDEIVVEEKQSANLAVREEESTDMQENDGWENDWSDPDLSGISEDEERGEERNEKMITRTVNVAKSLVDNLIKHNVDKSTGADLALYVISLALVIEKTEIEPELAFKIPYKTIFAIAKRYMNVQLKCDSDARSSINDYYCDENLYKLLSEAIEAVKSITPESC